MDLMTKALLSSTTERLEKSRDYLRLLLRPAEHKAVFNQTQVDHFRYQINEIEKELERRNTP